MTDQNDSLQEELTPQKQSRAIIDVDEEWPWYARVGAYVVNAIPVVLWLVFSYYAVDYFSHNPDLVARRDLTLNITVWAVIIGILAEISFITLVSWCIPFLSYKRLRKNGSDIEKAACYIFWGMLAIAGALIISSAIR
jgi:hypothetical protein